MISSTAQKPSAEQAPQLQLPSPGDKRAWQNFISEYEPSIRSAIWHFPLHETELQDAMQHTWIRLLEKHHTIHNPKSLRGWLRTVARNECLNRIRQKQRATATDPDDLAVWETKDHSFSPDQIAVQQATRSLLCEALTELREDWRSVVVGSVVEKRSYRELEQLLGIPGGSIGPMRMRALRKLSQSTKLRLLNA